MRKARWGLTAAGILLFLFLLSACGRQAAAVVVAGSTSVQPYADMLAEEYAVRRPDKVIDVQGGGSSAGITAVRSGTAHLGMSSRALKEDEQDLWSVEIAKDGLAIIVHPDNPAGSLTLEELRGIYAGDITRWNELDIPGAPDAKIHIIAREEGSGTRSTFEELVMGGRRITRKAIIQDSNGAVRQIVTGDRYSVGFISLGLVDEGEKPVKAMRLDGVEATLENVINGSYGFFRSFIFVAQEEPAGPAKEFIEYILSDEGQRVLMKEGLVKGSAGGNGK